MENEEFKNTMNQEKFIDAIIRGVRHQAIEDSLDNLRELEYRRPRRKQHTEIEKSNVEWFNNLTEENQKRLAMIITDAVDRSIFSFLCVLDNVSFIEGYGEKGDVILQFEKFGKTIPLNHVRECDELHAIYDVETRERGLTQQG